MAVPRPVEAMVDGLLLDGNRYDDLANRKQRRPATSSRCLPPAAGEWCAARIVWMALSSPVSSARVADRAGRSFNIHRLGLDLVRPSAPRLARTPAGTAAAASMHAPVSNPPRSTRPRRRARIRLQPCGRQFSTSVVSARAGPQRLEYGPQKPGCTTNAWCVEDQQLRLADGAAAEMRWRWPPRTRRCRALHRLPTSEARRRDEKPYGLGHAQRVSSSSETSAPHDPGDVAAKASSKRKAVSTTTDTTWASSAHWPGAPPVQQKTSRFAPAAGAGTICPRRPDQRHSAGGPSDGEVHVLEKPLLRGRPTSSWCSTVQPGGAPRWP